MDEIRIDSRARKYDGWAKLDEIEFRRAEPDGSWSEPLKRLVVECGDAVGVLLQCKESGQLLFARQARLPMEKHGDLFPLELVAGKVDPGETDEQAACREVMEEVGLKVSALTQIATIYPSPGVISEMVTIFYAEFTGEPRRTDDTATEGIRFDWLTPDEAAEGLQNQTIRDAKTVVALQWLRSQA